jgi:PAS domain S-box-containing protein
MHIKSGKRSTPAEMELRLTAEKQLAALRTIENRPYQEHETQRLIHELEVHQIELEMQNRELQQIREELENSLEKYTDLYDFAPVGYCTLNREGTVKSANLPASDLLGLERSKIIGRRFGLFVTGDTRLHFSNFIENVFSSNARNTCELKLRKEGAQDLFVQIEARTIKSGLECSIAFMDVSDRKRAEEEFHRSRTRLAWVLEKTAVGTWFEKLPLIKLNGDARTRSLLFFTPETELTMDLFWSHIHPEDHEPLKRAIENAISGHSLFEVDFRALDPATGEIRWCHSAGQASYGADGTPELFDGIIYDITPRKQAREKLQKAHDELESNVRERTRELYTANLQLTQEIVGHKTAEESLRKAFAEITRLKDRIEAENICLQQEVDRQFNFGGLIGQSEALKQVCSQVGQVAAMNATVLLLGETGTGKGVVARAIHSASSRKGRALITVDCTTLPAALVESELFGRERGAFTGSDSKQIGRFELADGGTIFLDEVGEMPLELQSKLLRVIQDGEFERLGSPRTIKTDVRIIAATNRNLAEEVRNGKFREDLFYRLNVFPITLPPLRRRAEDIPLLVNHFVVKFNVKIGKRIETVSKDTLNSLQEYHWPGNVRELESVIERAVINSQGSTLKVLDCFEAIRNTGEPVGVDVRSLIELEQDHILQLLKKTGWRIEGKNGAAILLGLNASTLRARMRKYGIVRV